VKLLLDVPAAQSAMRGIRSGVGSRLPWLWKCTGDSDRGGCIMDTLGEYPVLPEFVRLRDGEGGLVEDNLWL
jgi:hypothetical protein